MATSPDIGTRRLLITPFSERHLTLSYVAWLNDPEVMRYSEQRHKQHTIDSCRAYWQSFMGVPHYFWAIEEVDMGLGHIGNMNAYVDAWNSLADIGIMIGEKKAQGKGYGLEAWTGICNFLFTECRMRKVTAGTISLNVPMIKLMQRAGMIDDGARRRHYINSEQEVDVIHMALFRQQADRATQAGSEADGEVL
jgi:[ribosomal protein S5]-alanine N-acetyltransferase